MSFDSPLDQVYLGGLVFLVMTTHLILMSHAPTRALRTVSFPDDEPLDPCLESLAEARAEIQSMGQLTQALQAPEKRTGETAAALQLPLPFAVDAALRDCDYARWKGRAMSEVQMKEPDAIFSWVTDPAAIPHGGESILCLLERVASWLDDRGRLGGRVVAVTHPAIIRAALLHAIGAPPAAFWRITIEPLCLVDLRGNKGRWTLRALAPSRL